MKIEEDIIRIDEDAEKIVAEGKAEAKRISSRLEDEKEKIAAAAEGRFMAELARIKKLYEDKLEKELKTVAEESRREEESAVERDRAVSEKIVQQIAESYREDRMPTESTY